MLRWCRGGSLSIRARAQGNSWGRGLDVMQRARAQVYVDPGSCLVKDVGTCDEGVPEKVSVLEYEGHVPRICQTRVRCSGEAPKSRYVPKPWPKKQYQHTSHPLHALFCPSPHALLRRSRRSPRTPLRTPRTPRSCTPLTWTTSFCNCQPHLNFSRNVKPSMRRPPHQQRNWWPVKKKETTPRWIQDELENLRYFW